MKTKKIITIILVIIWMVVVFYLSNQVSNDSSELSTKVTEIIFKIFNIEEIEPEQKLIAQGIIRKLAHYTLYTIGGILILLHINLYEIKLNKKIIISWIFRNVLCNNR